MWYEIGRLFSLARAWSPLARTLDPDGLAVFAHDRPPARRHARRANRLTRLADVATLARLSCNRPKTFTLERTIPWGTFVITPLTPPFMNPEVLSPACEQRLVHR